MLTAIPASDLDVLLKSSDDLAQFFGNLSVTQLKVKPSVNGGRDIVALCNRNGDIDSVTVCHVPPLSMAGHDSNAVVDLIATTLMAQLVLSRQLALEVKLVRNGPMVDVANPMVIPSIPMSVLHPPMGYLLHLGLNHVHEDGTKTIRFYADAGAIVTDSGDQQEGEDPKIVWRLIPELAERMSKGELEIVTWGISRPVKSDDFSSKTDVNKEQ